MFRASPRSINLQFQKCGLKATSPSDDGLPFSQSACKMKGLVASCCILVSIPRCQFIRDALSSGIRKLLWHLPASIHSCQKTVCFTATWAARVLFFVRRPVLRNCQESAPEVEGAYIQPLPTAAVTDHGSRLQAVGRCTIFPLVETDVINV